MARKFLEVFIEDELFIETVCGLVRYHMQILFMEKGIGRVQIKEMKRRVDIWEAALLGLCDRIGRAGVNIEKEIESVRGFLRICGASEEDLERIG